MNERDHTRFLDMLTESQRVQEFLAGRQQEELFTDMLLAYAVVRAIEIVGEAASQVSPATRLAYPDCRGVTLSACATGLSMVTAVLTGTLSGKLQRVTYRH